MDFSIFITPKLTPEIAVYLEETVKVEFVELKLGAGVVRKIPSSGFGILTGVSNKVNTIIYVGSDIHLNKHTKIFVDYYMPTNKDRLQSDLLNFGFEFRF